MKKEEYINDRINTIKDEQKITRDKYVRHENITFGIFAFFSGLSLFSIPVAPNISIASAAISAMIVCHKYKNAKKNELIEKRYEQELKHLNNLQTKEKMSDEIKNKKINKLLALSQKQKSTEIKYDNANILTRISNVVTVIGGIASFINPWSFWLPSLGICSNILLSKYERNKYRDKELLENRMNNLISDLDTDEYIQEETKEISNKKVNTKEEYNYNKINENKKGPKVYVKSRE